MCSSERPGAVERVLQRSRERTSSRAVELHVSAMLSAFDRHDWFLRKPHESSERAVGRVIAHQVVLHSHHRAQHVSDAACRVEEFRAALRVGACRSMVVELIIAVAG